MKRFLVELLVDAGFVIFVTLLAAVLINIVYFAVVILFHIHKPVGEMDILTVSFVIAIILYLTVYLNKKFEQEDKNKPWKI
jgi:hypothetical protein